MKVVGIHGIGNRFEGADRLSAAWLPALNSGLREAGQPLLPAEEYATVFYGALFRAPSARGGRIGAGPPEDDWSIDLLERWWQEAGRLSQENRGYQDPHGEDPRIQGPAAEGRGRVPGFVQAGLRQLSKSRFFRAWGTERALVGALREFRLFLHDLEIKRQILARVEREVGTDTRVLVGHSLGSLVAYEALCAHPEWGVDTLVTLGSPLGIRGLVFDILTPRPDGDRGVPPGVRRWVNIADHGDVVALEKRLAGLFEGVEDREIYNGWRSHDALRYLTAEVTGWAIGRGLAG